MSIPAPQAEAAALLRRLTGAEPVETHISAVFVGRDAAYKLKKAVNLGFLDFGSCAARERFSRRELALNQPHAPALYRSVHPLTRGPDGALRLGGEGAAEDWVLEMAPLPPAQFLENQAALPPPLLDALADAVHALHATAPPVAGWDAPAALRRVLDGNLAAARRAGLHAARLQALERACLAALERLSPWLASRAVAGFVRRCHGDLHLGNLCLLDGMPVPFDALEFDEALATIDTGYDLAFLLLDLDLRHGRAAANRVLNRYVARSGDPALVAGLPPWLALRGLIRAQVEATRGHDAEPYLAAAEAALVPAPPRLVAVGGLQGTGKSTLARALAPGLGAAPGALVLRSDEIRKRQYGVAPEQALPAAAYTAEASAAVFAELTALARAALAGGHAVVADAVFLRPEERAAIQAAAPTGVPFTGLWLTAPLAVLRARVAGRRGDASDATLAVLEAAAARDPGPLAWHVLDAAADPLPAARRLFAQHSSVL